MYKSEIEARICFFACNFLWDALSLFHVVNEEIAKDRIDEPYLNKWGKSFENLAHWSLEERWIPVAQGEIAYSEKDLLAETDKFGEFLMFWWDNALNNVAIEMYRKCTSLNESMWLYHYYCRFLQQVLVEFDQVLKELGFSSVYYQRYQNSISLFQDMAAAMELERPFLNNPGGIDKTVIQEIWAEMDAFAAKLGAEWRQAVLEAARHLRLPEFINDEVK